MICPSGGAPDSYAGILIGRRCIGIRKNPIEAVLDPAQEPIMASPPFTFGQMPDFTKLFADMKVPGLPSMDAFVAANRKNMETIAAANRVALEGAQAVARRHGEIMQQSMAEVSEAMKAFTSVESPQARAAKQAELLKQTYERAVANMKEIGDLIQRSNAEAVELLNKRFAEALDEVKALAAK
jgi:phasin family protein